MYLKRSYRKFATDRKGSEVGYSRRGQDFRYSRGNATKLNLHGQRRAVAQCLVTGCGCSGRSNYLVRKDLGG